MIKTRRRLAATSAIALALAALAPFPASASESPAITAPGAGGTAESWGSFGVAMQYVDNAVDPGDDFDGYVNGKWNDTVQMPADKTRIGAFLNLRDLSDDRMHAIMDELVARNPVAGTDEARIAAAYKAFMDTDAIEARGMAEARPFLDRIAAARTTRDVIDLFAAPGFASPIGIGVDADARNSGIYALYLGQAGLGMPDRDYYLSQDAKFVEIRARYLDFVTFALGKAGYADAPAAARQVLDLETAMARTMWDRTVSRNVELTYNKLDRRALAKLGPRGLVTRFLNGSGAGKAPYAIVAQMPPTAGEQATARLAADPAKLGGGVPATLALIRATPVDTWKAWLAAHFIAGFAAYLPKEIDDRRFAFFGTTLTGQARQRQRWQRGISTVEGQIGELLGKYYADRFFPAANKAAMDDLVANLRRAMAANLQDLAWMGPETRVQAKAKLDAFTPKIGYPDTYKTYQGLVPKADTPLGNQIAAGKWRSDFDLARIGKPVDRSEWGMLPQTVNAYYNPLMNEIVFPAAILQPPYFSLTADPAVNYGAIGAVIGHEIGHGFDDQGAKFDGSGNLRDWWTPQDKANFEKLQVRLVAQYDQFCPFDNGKTCVNGQLTLGENIGDVGGLSLAYRAYRLSLGGKEAAVIDGFTGDQRFFMAWAQAWRSKVREMQARNFLVVDSHSPEKYRSNGTVRNFDEWYRAFDIKPGHKLYLPPEQRVRIW